MENGEVKGLVARGGYVLDIQWRNGKPQKVVVKPNLTNKCVIRSASAIKINGLLVKPTEKNGLYTLEFTAVKVKIYELLPL